MDKGRGEEIECEMNRALHFICTLKPHALIAMHCIWIRHFHVFVCLLNSLKFSKSTWASTKMWCHANSFVNLISPHSSTQRRKNTMTFAKRTRHKHNIDVDTQRASALSRAITNSIKFRDTLKHTFPLPFASTTFHVFLALLRQNGDWILGVSLLIILIICIRATFSIPSIFLIMFLPIWNLAVILKRGQMKWRIERMVAQILSWCTFQANGNSISQLELQMQFLFFIASHIASFGYSVSHAN